MNMEFLKNNLLYPSDTGKNDTYQDFLLKELILRDRLAIDRTVLAAESTFLAYIRTSLTLIVVGATLVHLSISLLSQTVGLAIILSGFFIFTFGYERTLRMKKKINALRRREEKVLQEVKK